MFVYVCVHVCIYVPLFKYGDSEYKKYTNVLLLLLFPIVLKTHLEYVDVMVEFSHHDIIRCVYIMMKTLLYWPET